MHASIKLLVLVQQILFFLKVFLYYNTSIIVILVRFTLMMFAHFVPGLTSISQMLGVFITALVLVSCGYFIGIKKSVFSPTKEISFLGFIVDSSKQAFRLSEDKRRKFARLRDQLLQSRSVSVKSLQRFTGKVISFTLAVPAARLYTREVNSSISKGLKSSKPVPMTRNLREELEHWKFLDSWNGFLPWRDERHCIV